MQALTEGGGAGGAAASAAERGAADKLRPAAKKVAGEIWRGDFPLRSDTYRFCSIFRRAGHEYLSGHFARRALALAHGSAAMERHRLVRAGRT